MSKEVVKKESAELTNQGGGMENIVGLEPEDLNMPYVYIVRPAAKHAVMENGEKAAVGTFFHQTKKKAYKEMDVLLVFAKKGTAVDRKQDGSEQEVRAWRTLMVTTDNLYNPFVMTFKGMNLWYGFKPFLSLLMAEGVKNPHTKVFKMTSKEITTQDGRTYPVPEIKIVGDTSAEQREIAKELVNRFGSVVENSEEEMDEVDTEDLINTLGDLDEPNK